MAQLKAVQLLNTIGNLPWKYESVTLRYLVIVILREHIEIASFTKLHDKIIYVLTLLDDFYYCHQVRDLFLAD